MSDEAKCPVHHGGTTAGTRSNRDWWPNQLNLDVLRQHSNLSDPLGPGFDYAEAFADARPGGGQARPRMN